MVAFSVLLPVRLIDYGLRDYGTARWEGGDPECEHKPQRPDGGDRSDRTLPLGRGGVYRDVCAKCGAIRIDAQLGLEPTPDEYVANMVAVFREVKRVLKDDGTLWLNIGDSYASNGEKQTGRNDGDRNGIDGFVGSTNYGDAGGKTKIKVETGLKPKDLIGIPWMLAFALRADGWYLRQDIIWAKPNPMPESVKDRCTKSHEYVFLLTKSARYYYDNEAIMEVATGYDGRKDTMMKGSAKYANGYVPNQPANTMAQKGHERWKRKNDDTGYGGDGTGFQDHSGYSNLENPYVRNKRSVWFIATQPTREAHFATFPEKLVEPCVLAGSRVGDVVFDPFVGSGTVVRVAIKNNRSGIGTELNPTYIHDIAMKRIDEIQPVLCTR
jgi:DNA modification methylase